MGWRTPSATVGGLGGGPERSLFEITRSLLRRYNGNHLLLTGGMGIEAMILGIFFFL